MELFSEIVGYEIHQSGQLKLVVCYWILPNGNAGGQQKNKKVVDKNKKAWYNKYIKWKRWKNEKSTKIKKNKKTIDKQKKTWYNKYIKTNKTFKKERGADYGKQGNKERSY